MWHVRVVCRVDIKKNESDREFIYVCEKHNDNVFHVLAEEKSKKERCQPIDKRQSHVAYPLGKPQPIRTSSRLGRVT